MNELFRPVRIGGLGLKNRAVMPAMGTGYASEKGEVSERLLSYLKRRAEGGAGLIITEVCAVHPLGRGFPGELGLYDESFLRGMERLTRAVKGAGAAVAAQLHHAGRETFPQLIGEQPVAPSAIPSRALGVTPRELTSGEVEELVGCFARAAARARDAGFDAVEVHGAHGYLVNQFLSPYSNKRRDEYGMPPLGRVRFAREIVREIKARAGKDFPVIFRFSSSELVRGGYELEYILPFLKVLEDEGVDAFHVSCGVYDSPGNPTCPGWHHPPGINLERAERVKRALGVPVIVVGKLHDPRIAAQAIAAGQADLVAFGRQHLADPDFLDKAAADSVEDIRFCLSCNQGCIERLTFQARPITCVINPECGDESRKAGRKERAGRYLVVGAGPAGLQAALTLGRAGAKVEVREREQEPGGQLKAASRPEGKQPLWEWVDWMVKHLKALGVELKLGSEVGPEALTDVRWEGVVIAAGARPKLPGIPGKESVRKLVEAREVLTGQKETGRRVIVVGSGPVGLEAADFLISHGCEVTVVEEKHFSPVNQLSSQGYYLHKQVRDRGSLLLDTRVLAVTREAAVLLVGGREQEVPVDTVVWAAGSEPEDWLVKVARETSLPCRAAGDVVEPRSILEATREGHRAALELLE